MRTDFYGSELFHNRSYSLSGNSVSIRAFTFYEQSVELLSATSELFSCVLAAFWLRFKVPSCGRHSILRGNSHNRRTVLSSILFEIQLSRATVHIRIFSYQRFRNSSSSKRNLPLNQIYFVRYVSIKTCFLLTYSLKSVQLHSILKIYNSVFNFFES